MHERLEAIVTGRVQMVMYRDFAQRKAYGLKRTGEVQNCTDGTVRVVAEGARPGLEIYLKKLHQGPLLASVGGVSVTWLPAIGNYEGFVITYGG